MPGTNRASHVALRIDTLPCGDQDAFLAAFEDSGLRTAHGTPIYTPRPRVVDCDDCGAWMPIDEIDVCNDTGDTLCPTCHAAYCGGPC